MENNTQVAVVCHDCVELFPGMRASKFRFEVDRKEHESFYFVVGHDFEVKCKIPAWKKSMHLEFLCDRDLSMMVNAEYYTPGVRKDLCYYLKNNNQFSFYKRDVSSRVTFSPLTKEVPTKYVIVGQVYHHEKRSNKMTEDFLNLLSIDNSKDVTFVVGDREIKAHKLILSTRNAKFAQLFELVNDASKIVVVNIEPNIFEMLLKFIYAEKVPDIDTEADSWVQLLIAAIEYNMEDLKDICQCYLGKLLSVENCIDIYTLSFATNTVNLKEKSIRFINANSVAVMKTNKYQDMIQSQPYMVAELLNNVLSKDEF